MSLRYMGRCRLNSINTKSMPGASARTESGLRNHTLCCAWDALNEAPSPENFGHSSQLSLTGFAGIAAPHLIGMEKHNGSEGRELQNQGCPKAGTKRANFAEIHACFTRLTAIPANTMHWAMIFTG